MKSSFKNTWEPSRCLAARAARQCRVSGSPCRCCDPDLASAPSVQTHRHVSCLRCWACGWRSAGVALWCRSHMRSSTNQQRCNDTWNELHWLFFIHCMLNRSQAYDKSCLLFVVYVFPRIFIPLTNKQPCCDYINKQGVEPAAAVVPSISFHAGLCFSGPEYIHHGRHASPCHSNINTEYLAKGHRDQLTSV